MNQLGAICVLDSVDRFGLTALCIQWDRAEEASRVLNQQGYFARGSMGQLVAHPAVSIERAARAMVMKIAAEYGATPIVRSWVAGAREQARPRQEFNAAADVEPTEVVESGENIERPRSGGA